MKAHMKYQTNLKEVELTAKTPHGKVGYWGKVRAVCANEIDQYCNKKKFDSLCRTGCPNYGQKWSCPPYAPLYNDFSKQHRILCVVLLGLNMNELDYIKQDYLKIKAANSMLKSRVDKVLRMCVEDGERYISTGSCRLCRTCRKKLGETCAHVRLRTYSFEAMGVNVSAMIKDIFDVELLWYKRGTIPMYTCVAAGLLTNNEAPCERLVSKLIEIE